MIEPLIGGERVSEYVERIFSIIALAVEEVIMYGFQKNLTGSIVIVEIPPEQRNPTNAQRFRRTLGDSEPMWQLTWTGKGFYESWWFARSVRLPS
jgi:hypothetical protein